MLEEQAEVSCLLFQPDKTRTAGSSGHPRRQVQSSSDLSKGTQQQGGPRKPQPPAIVQQGCRHRYGSERSVLGHYLLSMEPSFPFERGAKVIYTQGAAGTRQARAYLRPAAGTG